MRAKQDFNDICWRFSELELKYQQQSQTLTQGHKKPATLQNVQQSQGAEHVGLLSSTQSSFANLTQTVPNNLPFWRAESASNLPGHEEPLLMEISDQENEEPLRMEISYQENRVKDEEEDEEEYEPPPAIIADE